MFSFPNKDRKYDWIRDLVVSGHQVPFTGPIENCISAASQSVENGSSSGAQGYLETVTRANVVSQISTISLDSEQLDISGVSSENINDGRSSPANNTLQGHVPLSTPRMNAADIEGNVEQSIGHTLPSKYLRTYYDMMYYFGVCAYQPMSASSQINLQSAILVLLQKMLFLYVTIMSEFQSVSGVKYSLLEFFSGDGQHMYTGFIQLAFHLAFVLAKTCVVYMMTSGKVNVGRMIKSVEDYQQHYYSGVRDQSWTFKVVVMAAMSTMVIAGMRGFFGAGEEGADLPQLIKDSAYELSEDLFIWSIEGKNNTAAVLEAQYATNMTRTTITFGTIVIQRNMASHLQIGMTQDLIILVGMVVRMLVTDFMKEVRLVYKNVNNDDITRSNELQEKREITWEKLQRIRDVIRTLNQVYSPILKLLHVANLLMYGFVMYLIIFIHPSAIVFVLYAINLIKVELAYFVAGSIAEKNDEIREWIRNWGLVNGNIRVGGKDVDANMVLDDLKENPIGLGEGKFLIHPTFHFKFLGMVLSIFFSMADENK